MRGHSQENPFGGMTQAEIDQEFEKIRQNTNDLDAKPSEIMNELKSIDFNIRRKVIYKGKMAPMGCVYIVVNLKPGKTKYEGYKMIQGGQSVEFEFNVAKELRQLIKDKYSV